MINLKQEYLKLFTKGQNSAPLNVDWHSLIKLYTTATEGICFWLADWFNLNSSNNTRPLGYVIG